MTKKMDSGFIVYHGTSLNIAFAIASCGAILSPFESVLMKLMEAKRLLGVDVSAINHGRSIEELASLVIKGSYGPHERFRERTVCVSAELGTARVYAIQYDRVGGGIVLGVRVSEKELSSCAQGCGRGIYFVPSRLDLPGRLEEVYWSRGAAEAKGVVIEKFSKYSPRFSSLRAIGW
ncbi:MAG: hypothetical protein AABX47_03920 [Nanoarchaeota archaeon]